MDGNSSTYWCHLMCLSHGFSTEQDSYLCLRVFLVKNPDLKNITEYSDIARFIFKVFLLPEALLYWTNWSQNILSIFHSYISATFHYKQTKIWRFVHFKKLCWINCFSFPEKFIRLTTQGAMVLYESSPSMIEKVCWLD